MSAQALRVVEGGRAPHGWEALWTEDVWRHDELPHGDLASTYRGICFLHFEKFVQPWLKESAKRWARARLLGDTTPRTMSCYLTDVAHFSMWLAERAPEVLGPAMISRAVLEDYLLWVRRETAWKPATQQRRVVALRNLLAEQCEDGLAGLPRGAILHGAEIPRVDYRLPKELGADVFDQWTDPTNIRLLENEKHRTIVLLLAYTGFRVSSLITLPRDTLQFGPDGHPYLRYLNIKSKREAMLPVPPQVADQLKRQEEHLLEHYPNGTRWLLPAPPRRSRSMAAIGENHITHSSIRRTVKLYVRRAEIRTRDGELALKIHPHLFRHHLGTSMVNDGVPLPVIQEVLNHGSLDMTGRYARLHDETLKREVRQWHERVNRRGERIALPIDGPLEEAAWMKERIARARQALPNGYCGLPLVQTCPHPNACLSCDNFLTDGSFRAIHQEQRTQTRELLDRSRENNNVRLVEVLERDEASLTRILEGLDAIDEDQAPGVELDLREGGLPTGKEAA